MTNPEQRFRRHFALLWSSQMLSALGSQLNSLALVWIAVDYAGEAAGWIVGAGAGGQLVFGLIGGAYADRVDRQRLMIACDLIAAVTVLSLLLADFATVHGMVWLAATAFVIGACGAFFNPALQASMPMLTPNGQALQSANAWLDINRRIAVAVGPAMTGLLLALVPLSAFFAIDAATFIGSAIIIRMLGRNYDWAPQNTDNDSSLVVRIATGLRQAWSHRLLRWGLWQIGLWNVAVGPALSVGAALIVQRELGAGPEWFGYVLAAYGVGNVAANLVLARLPITQVDRTLFLGGLVAGVGWTAFAFTRTPELLLLVTALTAAGRPIADLMVLRIVQTDFPPAQVGRVFSVRQVTSRTLAAVGLALAVPVYTAVGVRTGVAVGGMLLAGSAVFGLTMFRRLAPAAPDSHSATDTGSN